MVNRVSIDQLDDLLEFLSERPALAKGVGLGARSKEAIEKMWNDLAIKLNSHGSGSSKSGDRWKKYWADIKHKSKMRLAKRRRDAFGTGGGPSSQDDLSEVDKKILAIIGEQAVFGDAEHRVPVFNLTQPEPIQRENIIVSQEGIITGDDAETVPALASPSTKGYTYTSYITDLPSKNHDQNMDSRDSEAPQTGVESPVSRPPQDRPRRRRNKLTARASSTVQPKVSPEWVIDLERHRVESEKKLADAALIMAEASRIQAESAREQAGVTRTLVDLVRRQSEDIRALLQLTREQISNSVLDL